MKRLLAIIVSISMVITFVPIISSINGIDYTYANNETEEVPEYQLVNYNFQTTKSYREIYIPEKIGKYYYTVEGSKNENNTYFYRLRSIKGSKTKIISGSYKKETDFRSVLTNGITAYYSPNSRIYRVNISTKEKTKIYTASKSGADKTSIEMLGCYGNSLYFIQTYEWCDDSYVESWEDVLYKYNISDGTTEEIFEAGEINIMSYSGQYGFLYLGYEDYNVTMDGTIYLFDAKNGDVIEVEDGDIDYDWYLGVKNGYIYYSQIYGWEDECIHEEELRIYKVPLNGGDRVLMKKIVTPNSDIIYTGNTCCTLSAWKGKYNVYYKYTYSDNKLTKIKKMKY